MLSATAAGSTIHLLTFKENRVKQFATLITKAKMWNSTCVWPGDVITFTE